MTSAKFKELLAAQGLDAPKESTLKELQQKMHATVAQNHAILDKLTSAAQ